MTARRSRLVAVRKSETKRGVGEPGPAAQPRVSERRAESDARRTAATRARLLDATIECLVEHGYVGATTVAICQRAGAPRGTLLHHFPSRSELMAAAIEHLLERRLHELREQLERAQSDEVQSPMAAAIERLWEMMSGPTGAAWIELVVAARTDRDLRKRISAAIRRFDEKVRATADELLPSLPGLPPTSTAIPFVLAILNGLAVDSVVRSRADLLPVLETLLALAQARETGVFPAPIRGG